MTDVKFGTSGLRGLASDLLAGPAAAHLAGFFDLMSEAYPAKNPLVLLGWDLRASSEALAAQVICVAEARQFSVEVCGPVPTPALAFAAQERGACAVMVTGSHIPADRNGLKFYSYSGEITKQDEVAIAGRAELVDPSTNLTPVSPVPDHDERRASLLSEWLDRYRAFFQDGILKGKRIGIYVGSSVAVEPIEKLLSDLGAEVISFGRDREFVPLDTEAVGQEVIERCRQAISKYRLDAIVSTDPDGDRPLVVDERGHLIEGDLLGWNVASYVKADVIATTVTANSAIASETIKIERTRVGSPYVIEAIERAIARGSKRVIGFEPNGGTLVGADLNLGKISLGRLVTRDSFLPIFAILAGSANSRKPLSAFVEEFGFKAKATNRLKNVATGRSQKLIDQFGEDENALRTFFNPHGLVIAVDKTDGLRVTLDEGKIIHLRPSGNAPEMRCYVEAQTDEDARQLLVQCMTHLSKILKRGEGGVVTQ